MTGSARRVPEMGADEFYGEYLPVVLEALPVRPRRP